MIKLRGRISKVHGNYVDGLMHVHNVHYYYLYLY